MKKKKRWIIDAHNLMHQIPEICSMLKQNHLEAMRMLCRRLASVCASEKRKATVVFDGVSLIIPGHYAGLTIIFSRERTADEVIISMMAEEGAGERWILVSDDREIRQRAFYHYVEIIRCSWFIGRILESGSKDDAALNSKKASAGTSAPKKRKIKPADPGAVENPNVSDEDLDQLLRLFKNKK